jgi:MFS family permease
MYYLAQGCTFLLAGSLADVLGSRRIFLTGCFLQTVCYLGSGLAQTGAQLLALRTVSGVAYPMCFISSMSIHRNHVPTGKLSKLASSCTSGSQYIGSAFGIILSGVLSETIGWRWGFHGAAILNLLAFLLSIWIIPTQTEETKYVTWTEMAEDIDWAGTLLASSLLALLFSALAYVSPSRNRNSKFRRTLTELQLASSQTTSQISADQAFSSPSLLAGSS